MGKLDYLRENVEMLKAEGTYRKLPVNHGPCANVINLNGRRVVNLSSNNYLGLANHPRLIDAAKRATEHYGVGAGSVRTIVGNQNLLEVGEDTWEFKEGGRHCFQSGLNCTSARSRQLSPKMI